MDTETKVWYHQQSNHEELILVIQCDPVAVGVCRNKNRKLIQKDNSEMTLFVSYEKTIRVKIERIMPVSLKTTIMDRMGLLV